MAPFSLLSFSAAYFLFRLSTTAAWVGGAIVGVQKHLAVGSSC